MGFLRRLDGQFNRVRVRTLVILLACSAVLFAQIRWDMISSGDRQGAATKFQMTSSGVSAPGTCTTGELFFDTNATVGRNLLGCTSTNTWNLLGDGTGGGGDTIPVGTVTHFDLSSCPADWTEYTVLRGKYTVGLPSGGTLNGGSGTALTDQQARSTGVHSHAVNATHDHTATDAGHVHANSSPVFSGQADDPGSGAWAFSSWASTASGTANITVNSRTLNLSTDSDGTSTTPAPYVQLLACEKD